MLQAFSTRLQAAVGTLVAPPDSAEVIEATEPIKSLPLEGAVVTGVSIGERCVGMLGHVRGERFEVAIELAPGPSARGSAVAGSGFRPRASLMLKGDSDIGATGLGAVGAAWSGVTGRVEPDAPGCQGSGGCRGSEN